MNLCRLENRFGSNPNVGSNPTPSALTSPNGDHSVRAFLDHGQYGHRVDTKRGHPAASPR